MFLKTNENSKADHCKARLDQESYPYAPRRSHAVPLYACSVSLSLSLFLSLSNGRGINQFFHLKIRRGEGGEGAGSRVLGRHKRGPPKKVLKRRDFCLKSTGREAGGLYGQWNWKPMHPRPCQGCQELVTEKGQTLFKKRPNFGFY